MKRRFLELWIVRVLEHDSHKCLKAILYLLSLCFRAAVSVRVYCYDRGWKKIQDMQLPVVCIGNITAGGTGKTPLVDKLAQDIKHRVKLAIVSTGYRSIGVTRHDVIAPYDKKGRRVAATYCGDEPFLLQQHLKDVPIFLSKDRKKAIEVARHRGAEIILLDDGLQRRSILKQLVVVVLSAKDVFGKGYYLPRGFLRESPHRLKSADFLCVTGVKITKEEFQYLTCQLRQYSPAKIIGAEIQAQRIKGEKVLELSQVKGKKVGVFCGIGRPQSYMETLDALGVQRVATLISPDHCLPHPKEWDLFLKKAHDTGAEMILCTEKDFVKISFSKYDLLPLSYVESTLNIVHGIQHYQELKEQLVDLAHKG